MLDIESSALIDLIKNERSSDIPGLKQHLEEVAEECERSGKTALEVIENFGLLSRQEMLELMAESLGSYVWNPKSGDISRDIIEMVDDSTARTHNVLPIKFDGENLYLAMSRPLDYQVVETVHFILGHPIVPVPCDPDEFDRAFLRYYPEKVDTVADIGAEFGEHIEEIENDEEDHSNDAPIIKFVDVVMQQAIPK